MSNLQAGTYQPGGVGEDKTFPYYSRYTVANDTVRTTLFSTQLGGTNFTRLDQTNMPLGGQIPSSQRLVVKGVGIAYVGGAAKADANIIAIQKWLHTTALEVSIQDKAPIFQARLSFLLGVAISLFSDPTTAAEPVVFTLRNDLRPIFLLEKPIILAAQTPFKVDIVPGVAIGAQQATDGDFVDVTLFGNLETKV
jgi:hypothetical protein